MKQDRKYNRFLALMLFLCMATFAVAQSGDKLFMEGQRLQQTQTISSQNAAIKKFQSAKIVYTSVDKKKMCDNQIAICSKNIATLKRGGISSGKHVVKEPKHVEETPKFALSQNHVVFDGEQEGSVNVKVEAPTLDWTFTVPAGVGGTDNFLKVNRSSDAKSIDISVEANPQTLSREQIINVDYGNNRDTIFVKQTGKPVTLSTEKNQIEYGLKGGNKTVEIYTNSDSVIASNNGLTWYIESKPDWVETNVEVTKKKGIFGKGLKALKGIVSGHAAAAVQADVKVTNLKIIVSAIPKSSPIYSKGRKGEIVFASQDKRYKIVVLQQ